MCWRRDVLGPLEGAGCEIPPQPAGLKVLSETFVVSFRPCVRYSMPIAALTGPAHVSNNFACDIGSEIVHGIARRHQVVSTT